jgi:hypothetical protein
MKNKGTIDFKAKLLATLAIALMAAQYCTGFNVNANAATDINSSKKPQAQKSATKTVATKSPSVQQDKQSLSPGYKSSASWRQESMRRQSWWRQEYMRRQQMLRIHNWEHHQAAIAYRKAMQNPKSPQSLIYRYTYAQSHKKLKSPTQSIPDNKNTAGTNSTSETPSVNQNH